MAGGDNQVGEFFDDFGAGSKPQEEVLFSEDDFRRLRTLFLDQALSLEELHRRYRAALEEILAAQGRTVEWALANHGHYPYCAAYAHADDLARVRDEAVAAARECGALLPKEEWTPPPPDEEPETAADYE